MITVTVTHTANQLASVSLKDLLTITSIITLIHLWQIIRGLVTVFRPPCRLRVRTIDPSRLPVRVHGTSCLSVYVTLGYRWLLSMPTWRHTNFPQCLRPRRICDIYDFFAPHINVLTYLLLYNWTTGYFLLQRMCIYLCQGGIIMAGSGVQIGENVLVVYNDPMRTSSLCVQWPNKTVLIVYNDPSPHTIRSLGVTSKVVPQSDWIIPGYYYPLRKFSEINLCPLAQYNATNTLGHFTVS